MTVATAIAGIIALSAGFEGYLLRRLGGMERLVMGVTGILLVWPVHSISILGMLVLIGSIVLQAKTRRSLSKELAPGGS